MPLTLDQKEVVAQLLEEAAAYHGKLQQALVELTVLEIKDPTNPVIKAIISETKKRFEDLGIYQRILENELGKPGLHLIERKPNV